MKITLLAALLALAGMLQAAKVSSVSVKMSDGTDLNTGDVIARCQVKVGDEFDPEQCARDVRALRDVGEYDNIVLKAEHLKQRASPEIHILFLRSVGGKPEQPCKRGIRILIMQSDLHIIPHRLPLKQPDILKGSGDPCLIDLDGRLSGDILFI